MRVTPRMVTDTTLNGLATNLARLERLQREVISGKRLNRPSDDPSDVSRALGLGASLSTGEQHLRNLDSSLAWLNATDTSLDSATQILQRARELAVQGANDALSPEQLAVLATEVNQLLEQTVAVGNSSLRGQRLFAGLKTDANPFTLVTGPPTSVTYSGDSGQMLREIDVGTTMQINVPGSSAFPGIYTALINLRDHLQAGSTVLVGTSDLPALDAATTSLLSIRADVGSRVNRLDSTRDRQLLIQERLTELLSKAQDTDFTEALTRFATQENVYKAALAMGGRIVQPSLLDFLR